MKPNPIALKQTQRYLSAWSRHHRSGGFGIHSPHAYQFVRTVLREKLPYYAYDGINSLVDAVKTSTTASQRSSLGLVSKKTARLLFRVANYVTPQRIFQSGAATGVESVAMLGVNSASRLWLYDPNIEHNTVAPGVLQAHLDRIETYDDERFAVDEFLAAGEGRDGAALALLNKPVDGAMACRLLDEQIVIVILNMHRDEAMNGLFDACCRHMTVGQTFTNGKIAILIPNPKLQREDFVLWL